MRSPLAGLVIAVAFAAGCGSNGVGQLAADGAVDAGSSDVGQPAPDAPADTGNSDVGQPAPDAPADTGNSDVGALGDAPAADATSDSPGDAQSALVAFVFTNSTSHSIYIQISGFSGQAYWALYQAGLRFTVDNSCETCDCASCPACAVCGRALARVKEIAPGAQHTWTWDGLFWQTVPNGCLAGLACERGERIPDGAVLDVGVTYSTSFAVNTTFGADDEFIGSALVSVGTFTNGPGASVALTVTQ